MKCLVLAGGYGTRMQGILGERPKALADIQGRCVLDRLLDGLSPLVSQVSLVSNARFYSLFEAWAAHSAHSADLFNNGSTQADNRLGALGDLDLLLSKTGYDAPALVVASDTILDFSLSGLLQQFQRTGCSQLAVRRNPDPADQRRRGVVQMDAEQRVTAFQEKPERPQSDIAASPIYLLTAEALARLPSYLAQGRPKDAPGSFIETLCQEQRVEGWWMPGSLFDVGNPESYRAAQEGLS
ncbi:MAG: NTP transferase domain-containing protein [Gammaproteobacteria bacterium]|jgi:glucose-1-phosphate thymidylyltransferase|nr:NTP transferase domain-containing protein [Gammaproteobacteria bacterium]MBT5052439.1 NTP transferase domain-containing protein [Gammaproteobacteria bacterium]